MSTPLARQNNDQRLLALLQALSLDVAQAETMDDAFSAVLGHICRFMDWPLGHLYLWSETVDAFVSSRVWYMEDASTIQPFRELSEATQFRRGEGTLGKVWESGEGVTVLDVRTESVFLRHIPAEETGIRAYFAFPIVIGGEVKAALEFFSPVSEAPNQPMTSVINHVSALLGLAIERQQSVAQLRLSQVRLAEAQRTAHVGYWEWDIVGDHVTWSDELFRIYGLTPASIDVDYAAFLARVHPSDLEEVRRKVEGAFLHGRDFELFYRIIRPDGSERILHARGHTVRDPGGKIARLHGTAQDMTEQKVAELELAHTVRQLTALMEVGQAIAATLELHLLYEVVLTRLRPLLGAEALILFIRKGDALEIVATDQEIQSQLVGKRLPLDSGVAGEVWQHGKALFLAGEACTSRLSQRLQMQARYRPQAMLAVPIRWHAEKIGVLEAVHSDSEAFKPGDLHLLEMAAVWTAIAIGNARQYEQLQRRLDESHALAAVTNALRETLDLNELLQLIVRQTQNVVRHAEWSTIHLLHPDTNQLHLAASAGIEIDPEEYTISLGEGVAGRVMNEGLVINVADVQSDPRRLPIDLSIRARALLVAPVESRQRRIGTISLQCSRPNVFTEADERLLTILGVQAGMAIENARLYAAQRRQLKRAERQRKRMQQLARRVVRAQEEERERIARELHDESGQSLTSLKISIALICGTLPEEMSAIRESLDDVLALTDRTMTNLRLLSHNLRPPGLDIYGLHAALEGLCQEFQAHTSIAVTYSGTDVPDLEPLPALSLYRFVQEALTNAARHGQATQVGVSLCREADAVVVQVADNGQGFELADALGASANGAGLVGIIERMEMVNGRLQVDSARGEGTVLTAVVPYKPEKT